MKKILVLAFLGIFALSLSACSKGTSTAAQQTFTVGMECNYAPYNWTTPTPTATSYPIDGTNQYCDGYDVNMAKTIANALNFKLVIKSMQWDGLIPALQAHQIDAIIAGMSPTAERELTIDFTNAYYTTPTTTAQVVVVKADGPYSKATGLNGFSGAKIAAQLGTLQDSEGLIEQLAGATHATALADYPSLVTALQSGVIDGFIAEQPVAEQILQSNSDLAIVNPDFKLPPAFTTSAIGVRKSDTNLKNDINGVLATISDQQRQDWMNQFIAASGTDLN